MKTYLVKVSALGSRMTRIEFGGGSPLLQLQDAVGGYIERAPVAMPPGMEFIDCFVDEEGLLKGPAVVVNLPVSEMCRETPGDFIAGDAVFAAHDGEGNTLGLGAGWCDILEKHLASLGAVREGGEA